MVTQVCLDRIAQQPPPLNHQCPSICSNADFINGTHCSTLGMPVDTPFLTLDPNGGGQGVPAYCYCCCSCFTAGTPIEKDHGTWAMVQDLEAGQTILAAGADLKWQATEIKFRNGPTSSADIQGLILIFYQMQGETAPRQILVTPGHLFLLASDGRLKASQYLAPGDLLAQADGGSAKVVLGILNDQPVPTSIHSLALVGDYDGSDLAGHLVNSNGIVTADYEVQVHFEADGAALVAPQQLPPEIGTPEYADLYQNPAAMALATTALPSVFGGVTHNLVTVPHSAKRWLTLDQARYLASTVKFRSLGDPSPRIAAQRVIGWARTVYPNLSFLVDWRCTEPNVSAFVSDGQSFVVISGALLRLPGVFSELALIALTSMAERLGGRNCVCDADYQAVAYVLRRMVTDTVYVGVVSRGLEQFAALCGLFGPESAADLDPCANPGLACRKQTLSNALSFFGVPACGVPPPTGLRLEKAILSTAQDVLSVTFSLPVEKTSAQNAANYSLLPALAITAAAVDSANPALVRLSVSGAVGGGSMVLLVERVVSQDNQPLAADGSHLLVQTA
ncbi:hypothetical protein [Duganella sp. HH101]|uniref:hypothetical protein n=1 Tax=Duganella sp. HH101 TaxID=1781066 RepID=UPI00089339F8|nr:hypothetical protein [Duganella sp. HH101]OFA01716.1 hypothetical protein DUGA2_40480 [Duganella sp. HH101]